MKKWLSWMEKNHPKVVKLGLERIIPVAKFLNLIKFDFPVVTVAGTNGKGSCVKILESILLDLGFKIGTYTSPHLIDYNERIRINGKNITDEKCIFAFNHVKKSLQYLNLLNTDKNLTFFEFATLSALVNFKFENLDIAILEIGLGGRLDAVNIVESDIAVISTIDVDHVGFLGNTRFKIAKEKAGIFKQNKIAVCGDLDPPKIIFEKAKELNVKLKVLHKDFEYFEEDDCWNYKSLKNRFSSLPKPNLPIQNAATSLMVLEELFKILKLKNKVTNNLNLKMKKEIKEENFIKFLPNIKNGLEHAKLKGRFQKIQIKNLEIILDVAHNSQSAKYLFDKISTLDKVEDVFAIFAIKNNKDLSAIIAPFFNVIKMWFLLDLDVNGVVSANDLKKIMKIKFSLTTEILHDKKNFLQNLANKKNKSRVIVFGSFFTVACILKCIDNI